MSNIFNTTNGASYDANGALIEKEAPTQQAPATETPLTETTVEAAPAAPAEGTPGSQQPNQEAKTEGSHGVAGLEEGTKEPQPLPEIDWEKLLNEKSGGKVKSWDEFNSRLTEVSPLTFSNEDSRKIFDYLREGKIDDVLQVYNEQRKLSALKEMTDKDVVRLSMEYKQSGLSGTDIDDEIAVQYTAEKPEAPEQDDYLDDEAFAKAQKAYEKELKRYERDQKALDRKLKKDASEARSFLESLKKDILLPDINPVNDEAAVDETAHQEMIEANKRFRQQYLESLDKSYNDFKEIPIKVTDEGISFDGKFEIADAEREQLKKDLAEKNVIDDLLLSRYIKGDIYDTRQLMEDLYFLNNKDKIIASAVKQALSKGKLDKIRETKNVDLDGQHKENFTPSKEVALHEFASSFIKAG